ncbi:MAG: hypothetical protein F4194_00105 [Acidimicrobiia bacterium]|nr:hypothetical protein [Acidimicrobiia bacterium]
MAAPASSTPQGTGILEEGGVVGGDCGFLDKGVLRKTGAALMVSALPVGFDPVGSRDVFGRKAASKDLPPRCSSLILGKGLVTSRLRTVLSRLPVLSVVVLAAMAPGTTAAPAPVAIAHYDDSAEAGEHAAAVRALASTGIFLGTDCGDGKFCPGDPLSRWVMAVWLGRVAFGLNPSPDGSGRFVDVDADAWWSPFVDTLAELDITQGCRLRPARYCPDQPVTRAQMASFLTRAFDLPTAESAGFTDTVGNVHAGNIDALAAERITLGCATRPARYCPDRPVTRAEAATFLARAVNLVPRAEVVQEVEPIRELERAGDLHLVSQYTTYHYCCSARVTNIHLIADLVDGAVVKPGQRFSLNRRVGRRTSEKGFLEAGTLVNGTLVATVGGGVSQFATTLYNAVFWGGYQDVIHMPHSGYFSRYPEGIEATINWPDIDLIFRNDSSSEVLIRAEYTDTSLTVKLFGDNNGRSVAGEWKNGEGHLEVLFEGGPEARVVTAEVSERLDIVDPPSPSLVAEPEIAVGHKEYVQVAQAGWTTRVIRTIRQAGEETTRRWKITYEPRRAIIKVNPCMLDGTCRDPLG